MLTPGELPAHLAERCRLLEPAARVEPGGYVLWWARHALRDAGNPALDIALHAAAALGVPVLAYGGLHGAHPHASDRHHMFILQSLREWQAALRARGITTLVSLPVDGRPGPLRTLVAHSRLVVVDELPVPPLAGWTRRLAAEAGRATWAVDARCIVPMQLSPDAPTRAFEFRRRFAAEYAARVPQGWADAGVAALGRAEPPPGVAGIELADADLAELLARCAIDHTVPPVADTPGGMIAGRARWQAFLADGLARYHRDRNDAALAAGVSRISPYLHYGCLSPFEVAREAHSAGGPGAEKFLDELLTWRELAHHFCCHTAAAPDSLAALPAWARATLAEHAPDRRPRLPGWEALARARSGEPLWDLAQASLLRHGELHNNLRMSWGKALAEWTRTPAEALDTLVDLNHRYALDGSDPNSCGGLLWCLGQFDRPFPPPRPVLGTVRPRSLEAHAARLDVAALRRHVLRPNGRRLSVAVIGAGAAGAMVARTLADQGHDVQVFEKSRGPGGRMATRRADELQFDHGAQYLTLRDPRLARLRAAWAESGVIAPWPAAGSARGARWVATPGMSALARHLLDGVPVRFQFTIEAAQRRGGRWQLDGRDASGALEAVGDFDALVVATPAPQAARLLDGLTPLAGPLGAADYAPCWAVMAGGIDAGAQPALLSAAQALRAQADRDGPLAWVAHDGGKPGRGGDCWVLQAGERWSLAALECEPAEIAALLWGEFTARAGLETAPARHLQAHRWRFARVLRPLGRECLWDGDRQLAACGDYCLGARVEAALLSGAAAAGRLMTWASGAR